MLTLLASASSDFPVAAGAAPDATHSNQTTLNFIENRLIANLDYRDIFEVSRKLPP